MQLLILLLLVTESRPSSPLACSSICNVCSVRLLASSSSLVSIPVLPLPQPSSAAQVGISQVLIQACSAVPAHYLQWIVFYLQLCREKTVECRKKLEQVKTAKLQSWICWHQWSVDVYKHLFCSPAHDLQCGQQHWQHFGRKEVLDRTKLNVFKLHSFFQSLWSGLNTSWYTVFCFVFFFIKMSICCKA